MIEKYKKGDAYNDILKTLKHPQHLSSWNWRKEVCLD